VIFTATENKPRSVVPATAVCAAVVLLALVILSGGNRRVEIAAVGVALIALLALRRSLLIAWPRLVSTLILIILFIPIRRYALPGGLPFQLEPYRLFVAVLALGWGASLLVDPQAKVRRTGFEGPLLVIVASAVASVVANPSRVAATSTEVNKALMFLLSFILVLYLLASTIRRLDNIDYLAKTLVGGGGVVSLFAIVEARTGFNVFNHLSKVMPFLRDTGDVGGYRRLGTDKTRVFASAQHPIALSAALVILLPLALYLARRYGQRRWHVCALMYAIAIASTISRTGLMMLVVVGIVFLCLRPRATRRFWPALLLAPLAIHFVLPGTLGAIKQSFMPRGGLVAEQHASANTSGSGRLADLGPALSAWKQQPLLGQGYGTQVVNLNAAGINANIFDDQWLGTLLGTGLVGFGGWLWLFVRSVRRFGREAKRDESERGWLLAAVTAGIASYAVGMLTFDAFAFIQVTFLLFILLAIGSSLLAERPTPLARRAERAGAEPLPL
jgi:O-antigen ligase/polysaccharide polymerase Wzy-like membrane protein